MLTSSLRQHVKSIIVADTTVNMLNGKRKHLPNESSYVSGVLGRIQALRRGGGDGRMWAGIILMSPERGWGREGERERERKNNKSQVAGCQLDSSLEITSMLR